ncbi:MAG: OprO/OprP family phosphate-selective porin [Fimbriimonadales bacterium]|nr:OprO/OprP family phosphate-selective porin [Fimbriimonadales bacterium]
MRRIVWFLASFLLWSASFAQTNPQEIEAEIQQIREQLKAMQALQERLAQLEAQLKALQQPAAARPPTVQMSGFVQFRYTHNTAQPVDANDLQRGAARENLFLRTVRVDVLARPRENLLYRVNLNANNTQVSVVDAFIQWRLQKGQVQAGLFRVPLLYETLESNADRLTPEASRLTEVLFPTERDVGVAYTYPLDRRANLTVGIFTGDRSSATQQSLTSRKSELVRFTYQASPTLNLWAGGMFGEGRTSIGGTPANYTRNRWGAGILWTTPQWGLRSEVIWGKHAGTTLTRRTVDVQGGYLLLSYALPHSDWLLYGRYDAFDSDTATPNNTFTRYGLGIQYQPEPATRFNLTWEHQMEPASNDQLTLQVQVRY